MASIIIPVYNAADDLYRCLLSVIDNTDTEKNSVTVIDDCSTDKSISGFLDDLSGFFPTVNILRNKKNLGFAGTCNRGILETKGDVILLNSDTVVTPYWVEKLSAAAYSDDYCATVTPVSNNATICSVPVRNKNNGLPKHLTLEEMSYLIETANAGIYRKIPVGVGFCLYIRRNVIDSIGILDDIAFKEGYGEENDFCFRARAAGYHHLLAADTYVYHKGGASFLGVGNVKALENEDILRKRYVKFSGDAEAFRQKNPYGDVWDVFRNIYRVYDFDFNKPFILFISHGDPYSDEAVFRGGTEFHIQDLTDAVSNEYNAMVMFKHHEHHNVIVFKLAAGGAVNEFHFRTEEWISDDLRCSAWLNSILNVVIDAFPVSHIHIQHWLGLTMDVFTVPIERKIPFFVTLHDYLAICPVFDFLPGNGEHCCRFHDNPDRGALCGECCESNGTVSYERLKLYRTQMAELLPKAERVYAPSETAKGIVQSVYGLSNIKVIPHGLDDSPMPFDRFRPWGEKPYRVAMIGLCSKKKGSGGFLDMVKLSAYEPVEWHIFGAVADRDIYLFNEKFPDAIKIHGLYKKGTLAPLLKSHKIDLVVIAGIWPETFSYTLSEAHHAGIPVVGRDIGAVGERIGDNGFGVLVPPFSPPGEMLKTILETLSDKKAYDKLCRAFLMVSHKTVREMGGEYLEDYNKVPPRRGISSVRPEAVKYTLHGIDGKEEDFARYIGNGETRSLADFIRNHNFTTAIYYREKDYPFTGTNVLTETIGSGTEFDVEFDISDIGHVHELRWDVVEGYKCRAEIAGIELKLSDGLIAEYPLNRLTSNGVLGEGAFTVFDHDDPFFIISGIENILSKTVRIRIYGRWNVLLG